MTSAEWAALDANPLVTVSLTGSWLDAEVGDES